MKDNQKNIAITFNGEIYNYQELKRDLEQKGHIFSTKSDTEVILKAYIEYGENCPKYLDGMFAFVVWDEDNQSLFMARDRFGKKPLYYAFDRNGTLYCASEIKALLAAGIPGEIDEQAISNYLALTYVPPWKSIYKNTCLLPPSYAAVFKNGECKQSRYWRLEYAPRTISYDEAKEETRRLLADAVKKRMLASDVEVGALLSGGVDSTYVCLLASQYVAHPLKTFSLGYGDYINELPYARQASEAIGSEHYPLQAHGDMVTELEKIIAYFDEPHADSSDFPQHLVSRLAARKVKVALSGDGGDEIFMGYGWHTRHRNLSYRANTYEKLFLNPFEGRVRAYYAFKPLEQAFLWGRIAPPLNNDIYMRDAYAPDNDAMQNIVTFDLTTYLPGQLLTKVDRTSMMHSLEVRTPLLDTALVEFVCNLPIKYRAGDNGYKILLKDLLAERMPHEFVYRRKQGFGAPITKWLREKKMSEYALEQLGSGARIRALFVGRTINFLLRDFYERQRDRAAMRLWVLLCLEIWLRTREKFHP